MSKHQITLSEEMDRFVAAHVASGDFVSPEEAVQAGLRLLRSNMENAAKFEALQADINIGWEQIERGEAVKVSASEFLNRPRHG